MNKNRFFSFLLLVLVALFLSTYAYASSSSDESVLGNDRWSVQNDGDIVPITDSAYDIGASGSEVSSLYVDDLHAGASTMDTAVINGMVNFHYRATLADTYEYTLSGASGKSGWGYAACGDKGTFFRFTTAAAVTCVNWTTGVGTTNGTDNQFNIYDGGTSIVFENQLGSAKELDVNVWYDE